MSDLQALAAEAYVYGYPMVFNLDEVDRFTRKGMASVAPAPFNEFSHGSKLAGPGDSFVSINNDTLYSMAQIDLSGGALLLTVPDTGGALLRPAVRGRLDQQFRVRGAPCDRQRGGELSAHAAGVGGAGARGCHPDLRADHGGDDRRAVGLLGA